MQNSADPPPDPAQASPRIRPLDDGGDHRPEGESLRFVLLGAALLSIVLVWFLASSDRDAMPRARRVELSDTERAHLPQMLDIAGGELKIGEAKDSAASLPVAPFRMSRTEVTVEQFRIFASHSGYSNPHWSDFPCLGTTPDLSWNDPGYEQDDTYPVVCVSAEDARAFAAWLSRQTGQAVRLPTELEWEYAARAGSDARYWWGGNYDFGHADCADCTARQPVRPNFVGTRPANDFGLVDMADNVGEWTCSAFAPMASGALAACAGTFDETANLVVRGGSWQEPAESLESRFRRPLGAYHRNVWTGFRIAAPADAAAAP